MPYGGAADAPQRLPIAWRASPMADLRVHISANPSGWQLQWHGGDTRVGEPVEIPAQLATQLGHFGSAIAQAFDRRGPGGFAPLPLVAVSALGHTGAELREVCCKPVDERLRAHGGTHRLTVVSDVPEALNLPWEL